PGGGKEAAVARVRIERVDLTLGALADFVTRPRCSPERRALAGARIDEGKRGGLELVVTRGVARAGRISTARHERTDERSREHENERELHEETSRTRTLVDGPSDRRGRLFSLAVM